MKILYISHNAYWYYLSKIEEKYQDYHSDYFESASAFSHKRAKYYDDYDYIIDFSCNFLDEVKEKRLTNYAKSISKNKNKRVTIGYSYILPENKRISKDIFSEVKIISIKGDTVTKEIVRELPIKPHFNPSALMDMVVNKHNELENQKVIKKKMQ